MLDRGDATYACPSAHNFDIAREGYVNLLPPHRRPRESGDSAEMMRSRRAFLETGAYEPLGHALAEATNGAGTVLDVGCGEGWFTSRLGGARVAGVDISRPGIRLASRRDRRSEYAVASAYALPIPDGSLDALVSNFGPVEAAEFHRVVRPGGVVVAAHPGARHLHALRALVYDRPEEHEVKEPLRHAPGLFEREESRSVTHPFTVDDVADLLAMTPYVWHLDDAAKRRLDDPGSLTTELDVRVTVYRRRSTSSASDST